MKQNQQNINKKGKRDHFYFAFDDQPEQKPARLSFEDQIDWVKNNHKSINYGLAPGLIASGITPPGPFIYI